MSKQQSTEILAKRALQVQRGAARAAVLGVNDGLVSVLCIILAVAGSGADAHAVLIAGLAGLLAGAISMAAGEWISVQAQVELFGGIIKDIKRLLASDRDAVLAQVATSLRHDDGQTNASVEQAVAAIAGDDERLTTIYARHVMGFNPDELGSPWVAAGSSFALFTLGACVPLVPWLFTGHNVAIWLSIILTAVAGLLVGGYIGSSSGKSVVYGALRQLGIIIFAAAVTYGVGHMFGVSVG